MSPSKFNLARSAKKNLFTKPQTLFYRAATCKIDTLFQSFNSEITETMPQKNLFTTLIGINAYPKNPLNGCVHDVLEMDVFLRKLCQQ